MIDAAATWRAGTYLARSRRTVLVTELVEAERFEAVPRVHDLAEVTQVYGRERHAVLAVEREELAIEALVKQRAAMVRHVSAAPGRVTCGRGLVNLGDECLPPLRR